MAGTAQPQRARLGRPVVPVAAGAHARSSVRPRRVVLAEQILPVVVAIRRAHHGMDVLPVRPLRIRRGVAQIHRALVIKFEQNHRTVNPIIKYTVVRRDGGGAGGKNLALGPISRILFHTLRCFDRHFSRARLATDLACVARLHSACTVLRMAKQAATYPWLSDGPPSHLFCLAPEGVYRAADVAVGAVGSYPTFSPLLRKGVRREGESESGFPLSLLLFPFTRIAQRFVFCDTVRRRALTRGAPTCGEARAASCPVVSGLSSPNFYRARHYPHLGIKELGATTRPQS